MLNNAIGYISLVLVFFICTSCVPLPTPYGAVLAPVPTLIDGAVESAEKSRKRSAEIKFSQAENRWRLAADCEAYRQKADAGDPVGQLNMNRILYHQMYLKRSNSRFANYDGDMCGAEKSASATSEVEREAEGYLEMAMKGGYPPALTYFECKKI
ncbi:MULTISPECIES: hypothetical protein [Burkholderia]|uniref:hypothetical protein n=1 Tax=Burkholderia TaxID=32008 RepID=UPI000F5E6337|nr:MULTISPECIES: hypothetical protein [Burkholderia]MBY4870933.1 hypothetical protein [Burkholderia anthina]